MPRAQGRPKGSLVPCCSRGLHWTLILSANQAQVSLGLPRLLGIMPHPLPRTHTSYPRLQPWCPSALIAFLSIPRPLWSTGQWCYTIKLWRQHGDEAISWGVLQPEAGRGVCILTLRERNTKPGSLGMTVGNSIFQCHGGTGSQEYL